MKECTRVKRMLSRYLDGETDRAGKSMVETHLAGCPLCAKEFSALLRIKELAVGMDRKALPRDYMVLRLRDTIASARYAKEKFSLAGMGSFARKLIPVPVAAIIISVLFMVLVAKQPISASSFEDHIFSERSATTETALEVILGSQN